MKTQTHYKLIYRNSNHQVAFMWWPGCDAAAAHCNAETALGLHILGIAVVPGAENNFFCSDVVRSEVPDREAHPAEHRAWLDANTDADTTLAYR